MHDIKDERLALKGRDRTEWAWQNMPVLSQIEQRFLREKPLKGLRTALCLHVTTETANLARVLKTGGAEVWLCASNPLSTQDDVAAHLAVDLGIHIHALCGETDEKYYEHIRSCLSAKPDLTMDDGADLVSTVHKEYPELANTILGGTEETTTGVIRLRSMEKEKVLRYPIVAVNDADTKHLFDNRYGTGQSTIDGIIRATNTLIAGSNFVVAGYGMCGKGLARRASGLGARVLVTEIDPIKALEAAMDGFRVVTMQEAAPLGDIFCTVTGNIHVIRQEHFNVMKDGALVCNSGHFNVELDLATLQKEAVSRRNIRNFVEEFRLKNHRRILVLGEGRLINLAAAEGHPACVMDMSFANQALAMEWMAKNYKGLEKKVYLLPKSVDADIALLKLTSMGNTLDTLTPEQRTYLESWRHGT